MTFTAQALSSANEAIEAAAAPVLAVYDQIIAQNDALARMLDRDDDSAEATAIRMARVLADEVVLYIEAALQHARQRIAEAHQVEAEHVVTVDRLISKGARG